ncbi:MAG: amidohydrolase [Peptococcaceae bacterium]|nr:amidohydrolase [Peptococcaceae bacterium]
MIAITGGHVVTMTDIEYQVGTVLIKNGKVDRVLEGIVEPPGWEIVDARGMMVMPGFIDAHCHLGIVEEVYQYEGDDGNEITDPVTPHLRSIDAVNPDDIGFQDALRGGVTTVVIAPGSANIFGGEMTALKTWGRSLDERIIKSPIGLKAALGENPKRVYGSQKKMPITRMASAGILRETLIKASEYLRKSKEFKQEGTGTVPDRDLKMEAVARVLNREIPIRIHAHRADDIMTGLRIAQEFNLKVVVEHCTEGSKIVEELAKNKIPVVLGPIIINRAKVELKDISLNTARILSEHGVEFAIMTDHPVVPIQYLAISAGLTVRGGLEEDKALKAITLTAARILGLDYQIGSIEPGKDGDIIILDGHPFDVRSKVVKVFISGDTAYDSKADSRTKNT